MSSNLTSLMARPIAVLCIYAAAHTYCVIGAPTTNPELAAIASARRAESSAAEQRLIDAWEDVAEPGAIPMRDMSMPVATYPDGRIRAKLIAKNALFPTNELSYIRAKGITLETFAHTGYLDGIFLAENCLLDRASKLGYCEGPVRILRKGVAVSGADMVVDMNTKNAKILRDPVVKVNRFMKELGRSFTK